MSTLPKYSRARRHAALVFEFIGITEDLRNRLDQRRASSVFELERVLLQWRTDVQALRARSYAQHQVIQMQENQLRHCAVCLEVERRGVRSHMHVAHAELVGYSNRCGN